MSLPPLTLTDTDYAQGESRHLEAREPQSCTQQARASTQHARSTHAARTQHEHITNARSKHTARTQLARDTYAVHTQHARTQHARSTHAARTQQARSKHAASTHAARARKPAASTTPCLTSLPRTYSMAGFAIIARSHPVHGARRAHPNEVSRRRYGVSPISFGGSPSSYGGSRNSFEGSPKRERRVTLIFFSIQNRKIFLTI